MNKELLLKVADAIEANPEHFDMDSFFDAKTCGTTACIAGWAAHISSGKSLDEWFATYAEQDFDFADHTKELLQLPRTAWLSLCYEGEWRNPGLQTSFYIAKTSKQKAKAAAEYVRWFVATDAGTKELQNSPA